MPKTAFTKADVQRVVEAALAGGLSHPKVTIEPNGRITLEPAAAARPVDPRMAAYDDDVDAELAAFLDKQGKE